MRLIPPSMTVALKQDRVLKISLDGPSGPREGPSRENRLPRPMFVKNCKARTLYPLVWGRKDGGAHWQGLLPHTSYLNMMYIDCRLKTLLVRTLPATSLLLPPPLRTGTNTIQIDIGTNIARNRANIGYYQYLYI